MKKATLCLTALCSLLILPALAQAADAPGVVARVTYWKIQAGMADQFEEGLKLHNALHAGQNDDTGLHTWVIVTGKRAGQYVRGSFGHHWADFDAVDEEVEAADEADAAVHLDPYLESGHTVIYNYLPDLSRPPAEEGPAPMVRLIYFRVRPGRQATFMGAVGKAHEGIGKTNWPTQYLWYETVDGGRIPEYVVVLPRDNRAGFAPQETTFPEMLAEAYGQEEADAIMGAFAESIESEWSETAAYREDLSYIPASD